MSKIVFFNMPAHGHTNPTIEVVKELVSRGHEVVYYSFSEFKDKIEGCGATYIGCDKYLPKLKIITKGIIASQEELTGNYRAHSARLRVVEKIKD